MIPGSHLAGQREFSPKGLAGTPVDLLETIGVSAETQVYVPVPAGCASFHHPLTLHASDANTTPNRRRSPSSRWSGRSGSSRGRRPSSWLRATG
jgi:ectoine hydroxylase-related dioxygenase (phytanoyl-CoA dioxygenase family)